METQIVEVNNNENQLTLARGSAKLCKDIVVKTAVNIRGKKYIRAEGWQSIASSFGCVASARDVRKVDGGISAIGEVRKLTDGSLVSQAEGFVGEDESTWSSRPEYARRAMAQTRGISRACRSAFAFVVTLMDEGLETTPAEEVPSEGFAPQQEIPTPKVISLDRAIKKAVKQESRNGVATSGRDIALGFGKYKGQTVRSLVKTEEGENYLRWVMKKEPNLAPDGKPYRADVELREIVAEVLMEIDTGKTHQEPTTDIEGGDKSDEIPF